MDKIDELRKKYAVYGYPLTEDFEFIAEAYEKYLSSNKDVDYGYLKYRIGLFVYTLKSYLSCGVINSAKFDEIKNEVWEIILW